MIEVKMIGSARVPIAESVPPLLTVSDFPVANFTITPGSSVNVASEGIVRSDVTLYRLPHRHVVVPVASVPPTVTVSDMATVQCA